MSDRARLLISCPDRPGIVAAVSTFLFEHGANIVRSDQHSTDPSSGRFFMRMEFHRDGADLDDLRADFDERVAARFDMNFTLVSAEVPKRVVVMVSREGHCLLDLLWRWERGELPAELVCVISNHPDHGDRVRGFGIPYVHIPVTRESKPRAEAEVLELIGGRCDLVVLARYMQILSGDFLDRVGAPIINIHHSFLPAFAGAEPYRRALERGVKIVGATAHYVTEELDAGPIIEQDVIRTSHRSTLEELERAGADVERLVLSRAVRWHLEDRVLVDGDRTVVF